MLLGMVPLAAGIITVGLGISELVWNPGLRVSRTFFASMFFAGNFDIALFALFGSSDQSSAVLLARVLLFTGVLAAGTNIFLASSLSVWKGASWTRDHPAFGFAVVVAMASAAGVSGSEASLPASAGSAPSDGSGGLFVLLGVALVGASVWALHSTRKASTDQYFRRATIWLGAAFALPAVSLSAVFGGGGGTAAMLAAASAPFLSAVLFAYVAVRYRTFTQLPVTSKAASFAYEDSMSPGSSLLVEGKGTGTAYGLFLAEMRKGSDGLVISRKHPGQVRELLGPQPAAVLWMCTQPGPDKIDPSSLSLLQGIIVDFLKKDRRSVVLLDGLEYLVSENHPDKVLRLIYGIKDVVTVSGSKLIIPLDPETLGEKDLAFFEREFKVLRPGPDQAAPGHAAAIGTP